MAPVFRFAALLLLACARPAGAQAASKPSTRPQTPLWLQTEHPVPMRLNAPVRARLVYDVFEHDRLVLPAGTEVVGQITAIEPDKPHRVQARLRGDFTRFNKPVVTFQAIVTPDGRSIAIDTIPARDGARLLRLTSPPHGRGGLIRRQIAASLRSVQGTWTALTGPGKGDRVRDFVRSQLPVHTQRIDRGTTWTTALATPLDSLVLPSGRDVATAGQDPAKQPHAKPTDTAAALEVEAFLDHPLSSARERVGELVTATVARPAYGADGTLAIPAGARLQGTIVRAKAARRFGRAGELRFNFTRLDFPASDAATSENLQTTLTGIDASTQANLQLDREGNARPKEKDRVIVPLLMLALAGQPLDRDRGENALGKDAVASNSLGIVGFVVGTAAGWRNVAAGIGYYGAALAIWDRWFRRGDETVFPQYTRIVLDTTVREAAPMQHSPPTP